MTKPKVAFFDFTSCEGCQLTILNLEAPDLLDLLNVVDIVEFREAISEKSAEYDIALIEGSYSRESEVKRLQEIRSKASIVIAMGACAHIGGVNALRNNQTREAVQSEVYPGNETAYPTNEKALPISACIKVDAFLPGCPVDTNEFVRVVKNLVLGKSPDLPTYPVCVDCKKHENVCVYEKGMTCLGPVTRAGCGAVCINSGEYCYGCRGLIPEPNIHSQKDILEKYHLTQEKIADKFKLFLSNSPEVL